MTEEVDVFLAHFGIKGMKWGVRKVRKNSESPFLNVGGKLTPRNQLEFDQTALGAAYRDVKADSKPFDLNKGASAADEYVGHGYTSGNSDYTKWTSKNAFYYKYATGEKVFSTLDGLGLWVGVDPKGNLIPEENFEAYKSKAPLKHDDKTLLEEVDDGRY